MRLILLIVIGIAVFSTIANSNMFFDIFEETKQQTRSTANILLPSFDVLHVEEHSKSVTVLLTAPEPNTFEGSLLRLHSENLEDLTMVIKNLGIKTVFIYEQDLKNIIQKQNPATEIILLN